ncbi:Outer membrane protein beta-barrel domain-containing protein [Dyadobacter sp. SG02]|uniref:porin family protein n=1 Tax=Dyadobacter sp. SG02 TaxID=1855291 RepID=UPI0008C8FC3A|nr:porin family protein [Dyadobacter sp. SG02]SEI56894.1 Outer membrane protein beta-barrel domain-containing protein [Dyadobacter sp. SG02]
MQRFQRLFKAALSVTTCALLTNAAHAQLSLGLKGGANFSTLVTENSNIDNFKTRVAPNFAVVFNYRLSPAFSIQAEPGFSGRGGVFRPQQGPPIVIVPGAPRQVVEKGAIKIGYFELPLLAQYRPRLTEKLEAIISAGPELRYRAGSRKEEATISTYVNDEKIGTVKHTESYSGDDAGSAFDIGAVAGAGLAYPIGRLKVFVEGRYHLGLRNLSNRDDVKVHNRGASAVLGVTIPILK